MDLDFQRYRGAHHGGVPTITGGLQRSRLESKQSFLPVLQRSPSKYHPSDGNLPVVDGPGLRNDPGVPPTAEYHHHRSFNDPRFPTIFVDGPGFRNDPGQNTIPVIKRSLLLVDLDSQRPGGPSTVESQQHRFFNDPRFPTILFTGCATIPVNIPSQSSMDPFCRWTWISNDPGEPTTAEDRTITGGLQRSVESQQSFLPVFATIPVKIPSQSSDDPCCWWTWIAQRSPGAPHGGVPITTGASMIPASQRSFLPIVHLDFRQNTIPGMAHSLLLEDLDSQRSRGAQHGGVPISPVLQRSPLPNDPFYRLRNDPRQNTIPVLNAIPDVDGPGFPTIPGGIPRRRPDNPGGPSTVESQYHRFFNGPRFPTILFTGCATIPVKIPSQSSMDP